jgi:ATP-dependent RNA helicase RhlE
LCEQRAISLSEVQIFVLDEADRMLDMGFIRDIKRILKMLPASRQNLMFSATYSEDIRQLANGFLRNPSALQVTPRNATADRVEQSAYRVPKDHKRHLLAHLIIEGNWHQVLVFCRTKHGANRLTQQLERSGINAMAIHGNKSQNARVKALQDFKENRITALVATEVAARGLDIKELPHVVNYELPNVPEDYVHRIGRTARAGSTGAAISLVSPDELSYLRDIEKLLKRKIDFVEPPKFEIKEGTHQPRNATDEHQPHQDPRRRPEHRSGGGRARPNHSGGGRAGGRNGGGNRGAGRADHQSYAPAGAGQATDAQPGARSSGGNSGGGHRGGNRGGGQGGNRSSTGGGSRGGSSRGGFARGARSAGGSRGSGGSQGGGQSGGGNTGGFSRMG